MWRAKFTDGFVIDELGGEGYIRPFKCVLDKQDLLEVLEIHLDNGDMFAINITKGLFSVTRGDERPLRTLSFYGLPQDYYAQEMLTNIRVVYFVRAHVNTSTSQLTGTQQEIIDFIGLGFQGNDSDGKNYQRYLAIKPNGEFDIRD